MSEDAETGWPMNEDGEQEEVLPEEEEEEEEELRRGKGRHDDDEDEEDEEEEEEEEEGPSKKRRKRSHKKQSRVNRFLDVEAQVDSEDEPESSGDEGEEGFLAEPGFEGEGEDEDLQRRSSIHQRLDREERELNDRDMANIAEQIEHRYRRTGATRYTGDPANIPQRLLMPSVNDANLWQVRVKPGKERDICFSLMRKAIDLEFTTRPLKILSVFQRDNLPGMIYVEARSQAQVQQSLNGLVNVFPGRGIALVPIEEMASLLQYKKKINPITEGAWVRIKRGKYQGDLAQVVDMTENGEEVGLKFIPRIDLNPKDEIGGNTADGKKRKKMGSGLSVSTRPQQRFFNVEEVVKVYGRKSVTMRAKGRVYVFQNDTFKDGYIEKDIRLSGIQTEDVNPTLDEITKFVKQQDGEDGEGVVDLSIIADASKKAAIVVLQPGDHVEVFEGEQTGVHGTVQSITGEIVTLSAEGLDLDGQNVEVEVPARSVRKKFKAGDHVKVMAGHNVDETGLVVSVVDNVVTFLSDMSLQEVSVFSKDLREAAEVGASTNVVGNYELHDLVQLDLQTVGVIFKTERDSFRVLDQNGQMRVVQPHQITMGRDSRRAIATNAEGHELRVEDNVKEIDGEGRKGRVLHIHQSFFAFLYNREITENGGVFVTRARSLTSVAPKNMLKPGGAPDLSKMNPAVGGAVQGGFVGSGAMGRGPRDRLIGVHVVVTKGTFKGYVGIIKDTNGPQARVELNTGNKVITIEKDKLKRPGRHGEAPQPLEAFNRSMGPPSGFGGSRTPNPYQDGFGSKTPAWGTSGRTPNPYAAPGGGRTPAWNASARTPNPYEGSKTPAWNASARTPNPFADGSKTPAWNASARTPNPYQNSGPNGWGDATPGASGGGGGGGGGGGAWGGATPGRASGSGSGSGGGGGGAWGGATPARAGAWGDATTGRSVNSWGSGADIADDTWNQASDNQPPYSAPTPGANPYSAPTPGAMGAPTPGASGAGAPTPSMYGAPTPGNFSAPTPSFARTPGVASTPFVPGGVPDVIPRNDFKADQETWLLDPSIKRPGLCVKFKPLRGGFDWHNGDYEDAEGVVIGVLQVGSEYTSTAQVYIKHPPRPGLPQEQAAVPIYHLVPIPPSKDELAVVLHGELKGQKVNVVEYDGDQLVISPADEEGGTISLAPSAQLCKWVKSWS